MLSSKVNAALTRLKEIEEKYKMKRKQQKWNRKGDSSISSVSMDLSEDFSVTLKESPRRVIKPQLNIKIPDTQFVDEKATNQIGSKLFGDKINLDMISLRNKLQKDKRQNLSSDIITIHENSSISSASVGFSVAKPVLGSKKLRQGAVSNKTSRRESNEKTKTRETKIEREKISDKSSEISGGRTSLNSWSKQSQMSKKSNISKSSFDPKSKEQRSKAIAKRPETANFVRQKSSSNSNHTESLNDNSIIEESIDATVNGSEIISELSCVDENIAVKVEDFTSISQNLEHLETKDASATIATSSKHLIVESGYANDTFEDVSSSTARSKSKFQKKEATDKDDHKNDDFENEKDDLTLKSIVTEIDLETSYVSDLDKIITNPDSTATYSIKPLNSTDSSLKEKRERSQQRSKFKESVLNDNNATDSNSIMSYENISSKLSSSEETKMDTKVVSCEKNSPTSESEINQQENGREESNGKTSDEMEKRTTSLDVTESMSSHSSKKIENKDVENEDVLDENAKERISQDIEDALEKLQRDMIETISKRHANSKTVKNVSKDSPESKAEFKVGYEETMTRNLTTKMEDERCRHSVKNQKFKYNNNDYERKKRPRARVKNTKSVKAHGSTKSKGGKALNLDEKQMRILRKRIMELRLRQEWEDLQKYLRELKGLRLKSPVTRNYFSPLEFPKIAEFTFDSESKSDDYAVFRERVLAIKQRLKDQYILYRDYCTMAQAINAHYVPTTLEDAKKMIYKTRKITVKTR